VWSGAISIDGPEVTGLVVGRPHTNADHLVGDERSI
jgi:hypothetical protein